MQRVDEEAGVGEIGTVVVLTVAGAAVIRIRFVDAFGFVPLQAFDVLFGVLEDVVVVAIFVGGGETLNREAGVVDAMFAAFGVDAAIVADLTFDELERLGDERVGGRAPVRMSPVAASAVTPMPFCLLNEPSSPCTCSK